MRILITGGAGFIGSQIADAYLQDGHAVAVLDNLRSGTRQNLSTQATFYHADITDAPAVAAAFGEFAPHVVSHHAAQLDVRVSVDEPVYDAQANILGGLNVLTNAVRVGASRFIFASSGGAIYGTPRTLPADERALEQPESPYGVTKLAFEHYLRVWQRLHNITPVMLRYANVYGPRQGATGEAGVVSVFGKRLLQNQNCTIFGDGTSARDYVYVGDVVEANRLAITRGDGQTLNIGTGQLTTIREVFDVLRELADANIEPEFSSARAGEVYRSSLECSRAREVLGWTPQTSFRDGARLTLEQLTLDWMREQS